jgi:hypothetical protein
LELGRRQASEALLGAVDVVAAGVEPKCHVRLMPRTVRAQLGVEPVDARHAGSERFLLSTQVLAHGAEVSLKRTCARADPLFANEPRQLEHRAFREMYLPPCVLHGELRTCHVAPKLVGAVSGDLESLDESRAVLDEH